MCLVSDFKISPHALKCTSSPTLTGHSAFLNAPLSNDNRCCHFATSERGLTAFGKSRQSENTFLLGRGKKTECVKFQTGYLSHPAALQG